MFEKYGSAADFSATGMMKQIKEEDDETQV